MGLVTFSGVAMATQCVWWWGVLQAPGPVAPSAIAQCLGGGVLGLAPGITLTQGALRRPPGQGAPTCQHRQIGPDPPTCGKAGAGSSVWGGAPPEPRLPCPKPSRPRAGRAAPLGGSGDLGVTPGLFFSPSFHWCPCPPRGRVNPRAPNQSPPPARPWQREGNGAPAWSPTPQPQLLSPQQEGLRPST